MVSNGTEAGKSGSGAPSAARYAGETKAASLVSAFNFAIQILFFASASFKCRLSGEV